MGMITGGVDGEEGEVQDGEIGQVGEERKFWGVRYGYIMGRRNFIGKMGARLGRLVLL